MPTKQKVWLKLIKVKLLYALGPLWLCQCFDVMLPYIAKYIIYPKYVFTVFQDTVLNVVGRRKEVLNKRSANLASKIDLSLWGGWGHQLEPLS